MGRNSDSTLQDSLVNINSGGIKKNSFDAIVIGSGMSGGWAAKELCEKGLKTLVLERGRNVEHIKDYPTANTPLWELKHRDHLKEKFIEENPQLCHAGEVTESIQNFFVQDKDHPTWKKSHSPGSEQPVGGNPGLSRWCQRWSD
jgi:choline dehydrogenase-like flavoprotein